MQLSDLPTAAFHEYPRFCDDSLVRPRSEPQTRPPWTLCSWSRYLRTQTQFAIGFGLFALITSNYSYAIVRSIHIQLLEAWLLSLNNRTWTLNYAIDCRNMLIATHRIEIATPSRCLEDDSGIWTLDLALLTHSNFCGFGDAIDAIHFFAKYFFNIIITSNNHIIKYDLKFLLFWDLFCSFVNNIFLKNNTKWDHIWGVGNQSAWSQIYLERHQDVFKICFFFWNAIGIQSDPKDTWTQFNRVKKVAFFLKWN